MNKYQKEKSREIRDIMRANGLWMDYKEAKRQWKKGIRAFRIGDMYAWKAADISHLGFSRKQLQEIGQAYYKILMYCAERYLTFTCEYEPYSGSYMMKFSGRSASGKRYGVCRSIGGDTLRLYRGSLMDLIDRLIDMVNREIQEFNFPTVITEPSFPRMTLPPWCMLDPSYSIKADGSVRINEVSIVRKE